MTFESIKEGILEAAALLSALGVLAGFGYKVYKKIKAIHDDVKSMKEMQQVQNEHENENYMNILRLTIMSEEMPLSERIAAGDKYIKDGGNGEVKHKYEQLLRQLDTE